MGTTIRNATLLLSALLGCGTNVLAQTGTWSTPIQLDSIAPNSGGGQLGPPVASGAADTALATWTKPTPPAATTQVLQISQKTSGANQWTTKATSISAPTTVPFYSSVAENPDGTAIAALDGTVTSRVGLTGAWSTPTVLGNGAYPLVGLDSQNDSFALFGRYSAACACYPDEILGTRPNAGAWSTQVIGPQQSAIAATNPLGMAVIVLITPSTTNASATLNVITRNSFTSPWTSPTHLTTNAWAYVVAINQNGLATVGWNDYGASNITLFVSQGQAGGTSWSARFALDSANHLTGGNVSTPALTAVPSSGQFVAIWSHSTVTPKAASIVSSTFSGAWSSPTQVTATVGGKFAIEASPDGSLVMAGWQTGVFGSRVGTTHFAALNPTTGTWGQPIAISSAMNLSFAPTITCGPGGTATALWLEGSGTSLKEAIYK